MAFRFVHPEVLVLLLLPLVLLFLRVRLNWTTVETPAIRYSDTRLMNGLSTGWRVRLRRLPDVLKATTWIILVIVLARPQDGQALQVVSGQGVDIVLALDISGSMSALDFQPANRLEAAKGVIRNFISEREFDRIGLVVFAEDAFQQTPPTLDYPILLNTLEEIQLVSNYGLSDGTAIGLGIASAGNMLRNSNASSKIIILLTDGANNAGRIGPLTAAQAVSMFGIKIYTIGIGKDGLVPVPIDDAGNTQLIESDLDELTLQAISDATNARYFRAEDLTNLQHVYNEINHLERSLVERQALVRWQERFELLLLLAIVTLTAERLLRHTAFQTLPWS